MSKVKNISGGALDVPILGRIVGDGEIVEVPDVQPGGDPADPAMALLWPGNRWEPVSDKAKPEKAAKE
jgi:hypothetical protein